MLAPVTQENTIAVAASTLVAFALFQPLRRRVQRAVDRRFDRSRYDGQRTVGRLCAITSAPDRGLRQRSEALLSTIGDSREATAEPSGCGAISGD